MLAKRLEKTAVEPKMEVVVALVEVELTAVKFCRVVEPVWRAVEKVERPETVRDPSVPTLVREEVVTDEFSVVPESVPAAAVTVMSAEPLKETPLISLAVCKTVADPAFPVAEPDEPVIDPVIGLVTVKLVRVPTEVRDDETTFEARVVPVIAVPETDPAEPVTFPVRFPEAEVKKRLVVEAVVAKKLVVVALVVVEFVKTAVDAVVAPKGELFIVPPLMVRLSATLLSARVPVNEGVKVCTFPAEVIVRTMFVSDVVAKV